MAKLTLNSTSTGSVSFDAPVTTENTTITVPAANAGMQVMTLATAQNTTSGTSIDFTGIPSWVKKITVMFNGVSTSGTSLTIVQLGSTSFQTTGYISSSGSTNSTTNGVSATTGMVFTNYFTAADLRTGIMTLTNMSGSTWLQVHNASTTNTGTVGSGSVTLSGTLDRIRITTVNGTDTFDAGSVNILYEGY
jgi:hypothetical protein